MDERLEYCAVTLESQASELGYYRRFRGSFVLWRAASANAAHWLGVQMHIRAGRPEILPTVGIIHPEVAHLRQWLLLQRESKPSSIVPALSMPLTAFADGQRSIPWKFDDRTACDAVIAEVLGLVSAAAAFYTEFVSLNQLVQALDGARGGTGAEETRLTNLCVSGLLAKLDATVVQAMADLADKVDEHCRRRAGVPDTYSDKYTGFLDRLGEISADNPFPRVVANRIAADLEWLCDHR